MIDLIRPFFKSQIKDLCRCRSFLQCLIDVDESEYGLSALDGEGKFDDQQVNQKILRWEQRNRNIMHACFYRYDLTRLVRGFIYEYARNYFSGDVMLSHNIFVRTETPCGKLYGCRTHSDNMPIPFLTLIPLHPVSGDGRPKF